MRKETTNTPLHRSGVFSYRAALAEYVQELLAGNGLLFEKVSGQAVERALVGLEDLDGLLVLATGFRMIKLRMFPTADMIPAMIFAMPVSYVWTAYIMPWLA